MLIKSRKYIHWHEFIGRGMKVSCFVAHYEKESIHTFSRPTNNVCGHLSSYYAVHTGADWEKIFHFDQKMNLDLF